MRPLHKASYRAPDVCDLGASCLFAIVRDHPFHDGNKRTALPACYVFLDIDGVELQASNTAVYELVTSAAAGSVNDAGIAFWVRQHAKVRG